MPSTILTLSDLRSLGVGIGLTDPALDLALTSEDEWLTQKAGAHVEDGDTAITIEEYAHGGYLYLARPARELVSVTQRLYLTDFSITGVEHELRDNGRVIYFYYYWTELTVIVEYYPILDLGKRKMALVELVKNTLAYNGYRHLEVPGADMEWMTCRQRILRQFEPRHGVA